MSTTHHPPCRVDDPITGNQESFGYLEVDGEQLYFARHHARHSPRGAVVICGPIGAERERAYRTLVELGRALASAGFEALRFDYRGIGESTGAFERLCLSDWRHDVECCTRDLTRQLPGVPVALYGVRAGALLAAHCFRAGLGDAMILAAPMDAGPLLQDILRRSLIAEMLANPHAPRTTRDACIARLERDELVNVDGYFWSGRLWRDAANLRLPFPDAHEPRPWKVVDFKGLPRTELPARAAPHLERDAEERFWDSSGPLVPRTSRLVDQTVALIDAALRKGG